MNLEERKRVRRLNAAWIAGEKIDGLLFPYNCLVEAIMPDGAVKTGWIVAATLDGPEPMYTVEARDGSEDIECPESMLKLLATAR